MSHASNFEKSTAIKTKAAGGKSEIEISDLWNVGKIPNGGYLMAHVAKVMASETSHPHPLAVTGYYLDKSDNGPATVFCEPLRSGKSISNVSARLMQNDSERIRFTAAFTDFTYAKGESHCEAFAPDIAPFEKSIKVAEVAPHLRMYEQFDMRFDPGSTGWNQGHLNKTSEMNAWLEYADGSPFDIFSLLMVPDMLPPAVFNRLGANGWVPTIEMTVNVRAVPETRRLQIRAKTRYLTQGFLEEDVEVWDHTGKILALCRQTAKLRVS